MYLGSRRLAILDLSASGRQSMTDQQDRWIVFSGEILNYVELRRELEAKGHSFITQAGTEIILHIYSEYGEAAFNRLNGVWAFAIAERGRLKHAKLVQYNGQQNSCAETNELSHKGDSWKEGPLDMCQKKCALRSFSNGVYILTSKSGERYGAGTVTWVSQASPSHR